MPGRTPLELPYAIDGDRVGNLTIKLMFNKVGSPLLRTPAVGIVRQVSL